MPNSRRNSFRRAQRNSCNLCTLDVSFLPSSSNGTYLPAGALPQQYYVCGSNPRPLVYNGVVADTSGTTYTNAAYCPDDSTDIEFDDIVGLHSSRSNSHYGNVEFSDEDIGRHHNQPIYSTVVPKTCRNTFQLLHPAEMYSTLV